MAQQLLADTEAGYNKGRYSVLQWVDAQEELFTLERELIETHTLVYLQLLELERITGQPMRPSKPSTSTSSTSKLSSNSQPATQQKRGIS